MEVQSLINILYLSIFPASILQLCFHLETITTEIFHPYKALRSLQTISHPPLHLPSVLIKYFIIPSTLLLLTLADGISFLCPSLSLTPSLSLRASCCAVKRVGESSLRMVGEDAQQCPPLFVVVVHRTSGWHHQQCQEQTMVQWVRVH